MAKQQSPWQTVSLHPLTGPLDTRSRPADLPAAAFRSKENFAVSPEGKLCRREGWPRAFADRLYDDAGNLLSSPGAHVGVHYHNHDHHHQGATREPITFLYESTGSDGTRRLFDGTQSRVSLLNEATGQWTDLITGKGAFGSVWRADSLQDYVLFTNNVDPIMAYPLAGGPAATIPGLSVPAVSAAKVIIQFAGVVFLMNVVASGKRQSSRIVWSDLNNPLIWTQVDPSIGGQQNLDYGDEILAAATLLGGLYIFTRRAIWRASVSGSGSQSFAFQRVYHEPDNQRGCLVYPYSLVSTGEFFYYLSREAIYRFSPYLAAPERASQDWGDWLHRASGVIFKKADTALSGVSCNSPCASYVPAKSELWISWPSGNNTVNNQTLVAQLDQRTADTVDAGFTSFVNFRETPPLAALCNENQSFLAASGYDYAIKQIGGVFYREYLVLSGAVAADQPAEATYGTIGYYSILRGLIPTGLFDREKCIRNLMIDDDTTEEAIPCVIRVRIGNSYHLADPADPDDTCAVQWRQLEDKLLACSDGSTIAALTAANLKPSVAKDFPCYEQNRYLYFEITIAAQDASPAIGGDTCFEQIACDVLVLPKP